MINLRTLSPPEWCNTDPARRVDEAACESVYVTYSDDAGGEVASPCSHNPADGGSCVTGAEYYC